MKFFYRKFRKGIMTIVLSIPFMFATQPAHAQNIAVILQKILETTTAILARVDNLPYYLKPLKDMADSWNKIDDSKDNVISVNQAGMSKVNVDFNTALDTQIDLTQKMTKDFLLLGSLGTTKELPPNANELTYAVLFGKLLIEGKSKEESDKLKIDSPPKYLSNAAAAGYKFSQPDLGLPDSDAKKQYQNFYNTIAAIQSFNNYAISALDAQQDKSGMHKYLRDYASDVDKWFSKVAGEDLGLVLRHTLLYTSQIYIQLDKMLTLQQQMLAAQAMTNSLLMIQVQQIVGEALSQKALQATTGG